MNFNHDEVAVSEEIVDFRNEKRFSWEAKGGKRCGMQRSIELCQFQRRNSVKDTKKNRKRKNLLNFKHEEVSHRKKIGHFRNEEEILLGNEGH